MISFWIDGTPREKLLISIAGMLAFFIIILQLILLPVVRAKESAQIAADRSAKTLDLLSQQAANLPAANTSRARVDDPDAIRRLILEAASSRGLTIERVLVDEQGSVIVQVDDAPAGSVFTWLLDVRRTTDAKILRANMNDSGSGFVKSSFEFAGAGN